MMAFLFEQLFLRLQILMSDCYARQLNVRDYNTSRRKSQVNVNLELYSQKVETSHSGIRTLPMGISYLQNSSFDRRDVSTEGMKLGFEYEMRFGE
jgi:hypothetical protein